MPPFPLQFPLSFLILFFYTITVWFVAQESQGSSWRTWASLLILICQSKASHDAGTERELTSKHCLFSEYNEKSWLFSYFNTTLYVWGRAFQEDSSSSRSQDAVTQPGSTRKRNSQVKGKVLFASFFGSPSITQKCRNRSRGGNHFSHSVPSVTGLIQAPCSPF